mgnify:FL=1
MPQLDLAEAEYYWDNIKRNVAEDHIAPVYFYKESDNKKFHVRPKGRDSYDLTLTPNGSWAQKYCYWFNKSYVKEIVERALKEDSHE